MNLIDALKQKKPIRRTSKPGHWFDPETLLAKLGTNRICPWSTDDFFADDWEIKDVPVEVTRKEFMKAYRDAVDVINESYLSATAMPLSSTIDDIVDLMAKKLGIGD